jgi:hypothetical protein
MPEANVTTDHKTIRKWAEKRGGRPSSVAGTGGKDEPGILRLDFGPKEKELEEVSWDDFFDKFDREKLAFLYQDETEDGSVSRFHKFISRATAQKKAS